MWKPQPRTVFRKDGPFHGHKVCNDVVWESPDENVYEVGGRISPEWNRLYDRRWEVEQYFALLKDNHWIEDHRFRGFPRVELHIMLGILMFQTMALDRMLEQGIEASRVGMFRAA